MEGGIHEGGRKTTWSKARRKAGREAER